MCALNARLNRLRIFSPDIRMRCFVVQIRSILSYGCKVWGPDVLAEMLDGGPPPRRNDSNNLAQGPFEVINADTIREFLQLLHAVAADYNMAWPAARMAAPLPASQSSQCLPPTPVAPQRAGSWTANAVCLLLL